VAVDLRTDFCGLSFKNPVIVPAGVHGRDGDTIREISRSGVAGICTKTIVSRPSPDVLPCFTAVKGGMLNAVFGSDKPSEYWFAEGIARAKEGESIVIANLAGFSPEEAAELATFGAKVLHPATAMPLVRAGIPIAVLNSRHPDRIGTTITPSAELERLGDSPVRSISWKRGITFASWTT